MSRKRNRNRSAGGGNAPAPKQQSGSNAGGGGGGGGGGNRRRRGTNRNRPGPKKVREERSDEATFWGDPAHLPDPRRDVRMTDRPAAVAKSLGPPPLPGHEQVSEHYFGVVYDRAVMTAGALAAAGGLIDAEALTAPHDDED